jgi:hypothetical protein
MRDLARLRHQTVSPNVWSTSGKAVRRSYSAWRLCSINGRMAAVYSNDLSSGVRRGSKLRTPKTIVSSGDLAKRFLELKQLRKQVHELEHSAGMDRQEDAPSRSEDGAPRK